MEALTFEPRVVARRRRALAKNGAADQSRTRPKLAAWQRLAHDLDPARLELIATHMALTEAIPLAAGLLDGKVRGRVAVDVNR